VRRANGDVLAVLGRLPFHDGKGIIQVLDHGRRRMPLTSTTAAPRLAFSCVSFVMRTSKGRPVVCRIEQAALARLPALQTDSLVIFQIYRGIIEKLASQKYDRGERKPLISAEDAIRIHPAE
jgi:hypothetical protein